MSEDISNSQQKASGSSDSSESIAAIAAKTASLPPALELEGVAYAYDGGLRVLDEITLSIEQGDFVAVLGPNGGGKSTLIKLVMGLLKPQAGSIKLFGGPVRKQAHRVGYLPQNVNANSEFPVSVMDVVLMGRLRVGGRRRRIGKEDRDIATEVLAKLGMENLAERRIGELSGGQRQRALIARALAGEPDLLLVDEPTSSVDAKGRDDVNELLRGLSKNMTILTVSHDIGVIPTMVNSVVCVNRTASFHGTPEITEDMLTHMYGPHATHDDDCSVELVAHGIPHRVLPHHHGGHGHGH